MTGLNWFPMACAGEVKELATALGSTNVEEMKNAVKKVIAAMTVNKDMSSLVPSVVNCMRTGETAINCMPLGPVFTRIRKA